MTFRRYPIPDRSTVHSLPDDLNSLLQPSNSRAASIISSSETCLDPLREILHRPAAADSDLSETSTPSSSSQTSKAKFHEVMIDQEVESTERPIERYSEQLSSYIRNSQVEIDPAFFNSLFTQLDTEEIFQVIETPIQVKDRPPVYFGQPGTMSLPQMQKYFEWMSSVLIQNNESEAARLLNLLKLGGRSGITLLSSYIIKQDQKELINAYLALLSFLFRRLPPAVMVSFIGKELMRKEGEAPLLDKEKIYLFVKLLKSITRYSSLYDPEISNLILKNTLLVDDVFIKMLKSQEHNKDAIEILSILEKTANTRFFYEFLQQYTQEKTLYIEEIQAQLPMSLYKHFLSLKKTEDVVSFAKIEGIADIISISVCNEIDSTNDPKERKEKIQSLSCQESPLVDFLILTEKLEEVRQKVNESYIDMAVSELTSNLKIDVDFKTVVKEIWAERFNRESVRKYLNLITRIRRGTETDAMLFHSILEMLNDRIFGKNALDRDLDFYYERLSFLFKNNILTASQVANLITCNDCARSSTDSYCQLVLSLITESNEAEIGLKFSGLHEPMFKYIEKLELEEKVRALETLFDQNSPLFTFFAEASREVQAKIEWMKRFADKGHQESQRKVSRYLLFSHIGSVSSNYTPKLI